MRSTFKVGFASSFKRTSELLGVPSPTAYKYYRWVVTRNAGIDSASTHRSGSRELELMEVVDGPSVAPGNGVASTNTSHAQPVTRLFDGLTGAGEGSNSNQDPVFPLIFTFEFGSPRVIVEYAVYCYTHPFALTRSFGLWTFEASNDGANWTVLDSPPLQTGWGQGERRAFTL